MNEIERDYVYAKGMASGCAQYAKLAVAIMLFVLVGLPCLMWGIGVLLYVWPLTLVFIIFALYTVFRTPKGYKHARTRAKASQAN